MFADNTLTPKEATRLCALGTLALEEAQAEAMTYAALAESVRHFTGHVMGPSLDVRAPALARSTSAGLASSSADNGEEILRITDAGRVEFIALMTADLRSSGAEINKLIIALKFRFLHLLDSNARREQADVLTNATDRELARLDGLRRHHAGDEGYLAAWLDHEVDALESRLSWLENLAAEF